MKAGPRADRLHLAHLVEAAERILSYVEGMTQEGFLLDPRTQDAVVRNFQIMGEAAKRISAETRGGHPQVPWREISAFRDVLVHRYEQIVPSEVWRAIQDDLPAALVALRRAAEHAEL